MARPRIGTSPQKQRALAVEDELWDRIVAAAGRNGLATSQWIRETLTRYLDGEFTASSQVKAAAAPVVVAAPLESVVEEPTSMDDPEKPDWMISRDEFDTAIEKSTGTKVDW